MTGQPNKKGRDDERTENRRSGRPGDGRQPRHPSPEQLKEFGGSAPQLVPCRRFGRGEVAPAIALLASKPASYVTVAPYTMGGEWKRESAAAQDVDRTWDGKERTMKDTRKKERRAMTKHMTGTRKEW